MSYDYLAGRLRQLKLQQRDLAEKLAMSESSLSHRMTGQVAWRVDEMYDVLRIIGATENSDRRLLLQPAVLPFIQEQSQ